MTTDFVAKRIVKQSKIELKGTPGEVFPLLCPVREIDWVEGWEQVSQLIFSGSGIAEEGCIFTSELAHEGPATWICSRYEPGNKRIEFIKVITGKAVVNLKLQVKSKDNRNSLLEIGFIMTGLNGEGNQFVTHYAEQGTGLFNMLIEKGLNHYLSTGEMLKGIHRL